MADEQALELAFYVPGVGSMGVTDSVRTDRAREHAVTEIVSRMPGCAIPNCSACASNKETAQRIVDDVTVATLRWVMAQAHWAAGDLDVVTLIEKAGAEFGGHVLAELQ